jgi:hypothetical protein
VSWGEERAKTREEGFSVLREGPVAVSKWVAHVHTISSKMDVSSSLFFFVNWAKVSPQECLYDFSRLQSANEPAFFSEKECELQDKHVIFDVVAFYV